MLLDESISSLSQKLKANTISPRDVIDECFARIEKLDPHIHSFITVVDKDVVEEKIKNLKKSDSPLYGIPYVMKDAYLTRSIRTTAASRVLDDYIPQYSATVYKKLEEAGAILIGKMNMDAWGHGASTENNDYGPTKNPWDIERSAGGSGGGPAAAIAARLAVFGIGEDTGGSIRNPAAWNNVTAMKVTYGRVSRYGAIAYASSLDTMGPTAKTSQDCALVLETIAGIDPFDATSSPKPVPKYSNESTSLKGKKIAFPVEFFDALEPEMKQIIVHARDVFTTLGAIVTDITLPMLEYGVPMYYILTSSETSSNLARYDGIRYGLGRSEFTQETKRRIMMGTYALSSGYYDAYYKKAQKARTLLRTAYTDTLSKFDAILAPVNPTMPPKFGELLDDPLKNMMADLYTGFINIIGMPSLALPAGFSSTGLPVGMQLIGGMFTEDTLFGLGAAYQSATDWHTKIPDIAK